MHEAVRAVTFLLPVLGSSQKALLVFGQLLIRWQPYWITLSVCWRRHELFGIQKRH